MGYVSRLIKQRSAKQEITISDNALALCGQYGIDWTEIKPMRTDGKITVLDIQKVIAGLELPNEQEQDNIINQNQIS